MRDTAIKPNIDLDYLVKGLETATDKENAHAWLQELGKVPGDDSARALVEAFRNCVWRETKVMILRAMGDFVSTRSLHFLIKIASNRLDLTLSKAAIEALGKTPGFTGQQFLLALLEHDDHPLTCNILAALASKSVLINQKIIVDRLGTHKEEDRHLENLIITLGNIGNSHDFPLILPYLSNSYVET